MKVVGFSFLLCFSFILSVSAQNFPISPNAYDSNGKRTGHWTILYDSTYQKEVRNPDSAFYYRLIRFENGKPVGKVRDFYRNGIKQWDGYLLALNPDVQDGEVNFYYENGKVHYSYAAKAGKMHGFFKEYALNGILTKEGQMKNDSLDGAWTYYDEQGIKMSMLMKKRNLNNGAVISFFPSGAIQKKGTKVNDSTEGRWDEFYESGKLKSREHFHKGMYHGEAITYFETGQVESKGQYISDNKTGVWEFFHENGKLSKTGAFDSVGLMAGTWKHYFANGNLNFVTGRKGGKFHGPYEDFYESGKQKTKATCDLDRWQGPLLEYYENGQLKKSISYALDSLDGRGIYYFPNGKISSEGSYVNNKKDGVWKFYREDGSLELEEQLSNGILNGRNVNYYSNEKIDTKRYYVDGAESGLFESFYENGNKKSVGNRIAGKRDGDWYWYYDNGQVASKESYKNGIWQGPYERYFNNGNKKNEGTAINDLEEGLKKIYYQNGNKKAEGNMLHDYRQGHWIFYDSLTGKKESEGEYAKGLLDGRWTFYNANEKPNEYSYYLKGFQETFFNIEDSLKKLSDYSKFEAARKALDWLEKVRKRDHKNDAIKKNKILYWKGYLASDEKKYDDAILFNKKYVEGVKKLQGDTTVSYANGVNGIAIALEKNGRPEEALALLKTLDAIYEKKGRETINEVTHYLNFAYTLGAMNRYEESVQYLNTTLQKRKANGKTNPENTQTILLSLADTYRNDLLKYDVAINVYQKILSLGDSLHLAPTDSYLQALYGIGQSYRGLYNNSLCLQWAKKAEPLLEKKKLTLPDSYLSNLQLIGSTYTRLNDLDSAMGTYSKMLNEVIAIGWQGTMKHTQALSGLAEIHYYLYRNEKALELWLQSKQILEKTGRTKTIDYVDVLQALSVLLPSIDKVNIPQAEKYLVQAVEITHSIPNASMKYRTMLLSLGEFYTSHVKYNEASETLKKLLTLFETAEGTGSVGYAKVLLRLGQNEFALRHYHVALDYYNKALEILETRRKDVPDFFIETLSEIGKTYNYLNENQKSESYARRAVDASNMLVGNESISTIDQLRNLGGILKDENLMTEAEKTYREAISISRKVVGENNLKYLFCLSDLADLYRDNGDNKKALEGYLHYYTKLKLLLPNETSDFVYVYENLGLVYERLGDNTNAEKNYLKCLTLTGNTFGKKSMRYAWNLRSLSTYYRNNDQPAVAENYGELATETARSILGEESSDYANFLVALAEIKRDREKNKAAESLFQKAVAIHRRNVADRFGSYISALEQLQSFYNQFGRYNDALDQLNVILPLIAGKWGKETRYIENLLNKSGIFQAMNNFDSARWYANYALQIGEELLPPGDWRILNSHNSLGYCDIKQFKFAEAREHFQYGITQRKISRQEKTEGYATSLHNLSSVQIELGEYAEAEKNQFESRRINTELKNNTGLIYSSLMLGKLYNTWGKVSLAEKFFKDAMTQQMKNISNNFYFLSDNEKAQFWKANKFFLEYFQSFALQRMTTNPGLINELYNLQLNSKGILLSTSNKIKKRILTSGDSTMINHYYQWLSQRDQLAQLYTLSKEELKLKKSKLDSLELSAKNLEKDLNITAEDLEKDRNGETNWREVQRTLSPTEAAVEIVRVKHHSTHPTDSTLYAALVLTSEMKNGPQAALLPDGKLLEGRALRFYKNAILSQLPDTVSYTYFWAPIERLLKNKSRIYLSLDGVYNSINLNSLRAPDSKFILDTKNITLVSNTKDIVLLKKKGGLHNRNTASLIGFPKFFIGKDQLLKKAQQRDYDFSKLSEEDRSGIAELPGTKTEIEKINRILHAHKWQVEMHTHEQASEEAIKKIQQPALLHIATHGFFMDEKDNSSWMSSSDPMLRAGLLFTGASNFLQDKISINEDNGILTAYEAANLNLDNTELVILSACETGKGEVQNGEGVYGLQRAFQTAGAKSILMSLWKVDDTATQELMTLFYQNWTSGKTKSEAFKLAQLSLKEKYPNPYYWGAFVMMGN